jgi:hypothetical protein
MLLQNEGHFYKMSTMFGAETGQEYTLLIYKDQYNSSLPGCVCYLFVLIEQISGTGSFKSCDEVKHRGLAAS